MQNPTDILQTETTQASAKVNGPHLPKTSFKILHRSLSNATSAFWKLTLPLSLAFTLSLQGQATEATIGLPIKRTYSIEEIGISRGPHLGFDRIGRLAIISDHRYVVLNDSTWIDIAEQNPDSPALMQVVNSDDQHSYYGSLATWGEAIYTNEGKVQIHSLRPEKYPAWVNSTNFSQIETLPSKVFFAGSNGVVYLDQATGKQEFIEIPHVTKIFTLNSKLYVSSTSKGTLLLDPVNLSMRQIEAVTIDQVAALDKDRVLISTTGQRLLVFDGASFNEWPAPINSGPLGRISCIRSLPNGGVAIAFDGKGLYIFSGDGHCRLALTTTGYRRIYDLAIQDPGILWLTTENSVQKLLYDSPVSVIDQQLDVVVGWPQVVQWENQTVIASNGRLYDMLLNEDGLSHQFKEVAGQPLAGSWAVDANDHHLLVGNGTGVYARSKSSFKPALQNFNTNRLFLARKDLCIVIGETEIAAIQWNGEAWKECVPRIAGVGFPSIVQHTSTSIWIELGLNRVARIWFSDEKLHSQIIDSFPWSKPAWINIGTLANLVVLTGPDQERVFFDEETGETREAPKLEKLLSSAPFPIIRIQEDDNGIIWASHDDGVLTMHPHESGYQIDSSSLDSIRDRFPTIKLSDSNHVWISTASALYHVDRNFNRATKLQLQPSIVSVTDGKTGKELYSPAHSPNPIEQLPYSQNHLAFRYFTSGYSPMQSPSYEFTMQSESDEWTIQSDDSLLTLPNLTEGDYQLKAQLRDGDRIVGKPVITEFTIDPPWYRATLAYLLYCAAAIMSSIGLIKLAMRQAKAKHTYLEALVRERTEELRSTMAKLTEEARNAATLAERNRLAGEIHDSLQQGLSGLILQLDATLKLPKLDPDVQSRLTVARRMVSFTRQEVQQSVWNLGSPLLENADLAEALRTVADLISPGIAKIELDVVGSPSRNIDSTTKHHLLRIAQEAITNAVRHSNAERIVVKLHYSDSTVDLEVSDNGVGFEPEEVFANGIGHFGLRGLRGRAAKINGDLRILSNTGSGTIIRIIISNTTTEDSEKTTLNEYRKN